MATKLNWYQQIENERLPPNEVHETEDGKTIRIEYREENDKIYKVTKVFEKRQCSVLPIVAERKKWKKFGDAANDPPGINSTTTTLADEIKMDFISSIDDDTLRDAIKSLIGIQCRRCKGSHLTAKCPHKDILQEHSVVHTAEKITPSSVNELSANSTNKYIPPQRRAGVSNDTGDRRRQNDGYTVRVSNLPDDTQDYDLRDLFQNYGRILRIHVAKDRSTNTSRGFAFVSFSEEANAKRAINCVNNFGYGYLILKVEWAKKYSYIYSYLYSHIKLIVHLNKSKQD